MVAARILRSVAIGRTRAHRFARCRCCTSLAGGGGGVNGSESPEDPVLPVLIVGAGQIGLVLSILLTKLGVECAVLEKNRTFSSHPQMHFINNRSMEVFRKIEELAEIERLQSPVDLWRKFIYYMSLTVQILGTVDQMQTQVVDSFDDKLLMGYECVSIDTSSSEWVSALVSSVDDGVYMERKVHCRLLGGADDVGSTVRKLVGITLKGEKELQNLVSVHFQSTYLGNHLLKEMFSLTQSIPVREVISGTVGAVVPSGVQKAIFNTLLSIGHAQASEMILNESNPLGSSRLSKLKKILAEGRSLQLQFPAEDLGFRYLQGALIPVAESTSNTFRLPTVRYRGYIPYADPGSRLPHLYVKMLLNNSIEEKVSTLDFVRSDVGEFLLIIAPVIDSYTLACAALEVADKFRISIWECIVWAADDLNGTMDKLH